jgi:uncharacterized delta-60 repeat protein
MSTAKLSSRRVMGLLLGHEAARRRAALRRGSRQLRPMAEGLEERALLSVGLDPTWGFGGVTPPNTPQNTSANSYTESINAVAWQSTSSEVVGVGTLTTTPTASGSTPTTSLIVTRYNSSGLLDTSFGTNGTATIPLTFGGVTYTVAEFSTNQYIAVQSNGSIDILATVTPTTSGASSEFLVVQLTPNGSIDTTFGSAGGTFIGNFGTTSSPSTSTSADAIAIGPAGKIDVVGSTVLPTPGTVFAVAQLNTNGSLDTTFNGTGTTTVNFGVGTAGSEDDTPNDVVVQSNGAIVVGGFATLPTTSSGLTLTDAAVARLNANGSLDTSFATGGLLTYTYNLGGASDDSVQAIALDGSQIVLAGDSTQQFPSGSSQSLEELTVTVLNSNGSFDTSFNGSGKYILSLTQGGINLSTTSSGVSVLPNGELLVGGSASQTNSFAINDGVFAELTSSGSLDPTYGTNGVALIPAPADTPFVVQPDGKVVFTTSNGVARTTAPVPAVASSTVVTVGTGTKAKATGVTITFNTAVNPTLSSNVSVYVVRTVKGRKVVKIKKKGGIVYNAATRTLTLSFAAKTAIGKGFTVVITPGGIVGADGEVLSNNTITITPSTTTT